MSSTSGRKNLHDYKARLIWDGNLGTGTTSYTGYGRKYRLQIEGKPAMTLKAGDVFFIPAGTVHAAKNAGSGTARVLATYVVEKGKPLAAMVK